MWPEPGTGMPLVLAIRSAYLPYASYEKTGHQMIWFHIKKTHTGYPCSSAKPAEWFPPSTCSDYQCEFALISSLPLYDWYFCHSGTKIPNDGSAYCWTTLQASQPRCTACCVLDCLQLRAAVSRVVLLCDVHISLAAWKQGGSCASFLRASGQCCSGAHVERSQRSGGWY